jgi:F-type H+-transporting ATPase subunit delta
MADLGRLQVLYTSLPGRYAHALFASGLRAGCLEEILDDFGKLADFCESSFRTKKLLSCCLLKEPELNECLKIISNDLSFCEIFSSFIKLLVLNKRFNLIQNVRYIYENAFRQHKGEHNVVVSSFFPLSPSQKKKVSTLASGIVEGAVVMKYETDKEILGGLKIAIDDLVIDASVLSQSRQMSTYLTESVMSRGNI